MTEFLRRVLTGLSIACLGGAGLGCPKRHVTKPPVVEPTPPSQLGRPDAPLHTELLLRATPAGTITQAGKPHSVVGAIPCWPTEGNGERLIVDGREIPYWWPLVSPEWIDHIKSKGANAVHIRLGPFVTEDACCGLQDVGGPIVAGLPNEKFWNRVHVGLRHAADKGVTVEVDVLDTWIIKHAVYGDVRSPLPAEDVHSATSLPLNPSVKAWIKKVVYETCNYPVIYQIGNESSLALGWSREWERAMYAEIRQAEQQEGCQQVVHMIGSNTRDESGPYDYFTTHSADAVTEPFAGRPIMVNEYNPSLAPSVFKARYCASRVSGQSFWYWRSDGSDQWQDASLNAILEGCDTASAFACGEPKPVDVHDFACHWNGQWYDCTPKAMNHDYCVSIGMGEMGGLPRSGCPIRNECPDTPGYEGMCAERVACERAAMKGFPVWRGNGHVEVNYSNENQLQARCDDCTSLTICSADGTTGCTAVPLR